MENLTAKIKDEYGSVKRYCKLKNWSFNSFKDAKYYKFVTPKGQEMLSTLLKDELINEETFLKYKK